MRIRVSLRLAALLLCAVLLPGAAFGQLRFVTPAAAPAAPSIVGELLSQGQQLEQERRWGEALTFYEDAVRRHPQDHSLTERLQLVRAHYDLGRRYSDNSFRQMLATLPLAQSLELYGEVLLKIQSHHVDPPGWQALSDAGLRALDIALCDDVFLEHHLADVPRARVDHFRRDLHARLAGGGVNGRQSAVDAVALAAQMARQQLGLSDNAVVLEYACGAANAMDAYSTYLTAGQLTEVYSQIEGNFVGLGIELKSSDGSLLVVKVIPGSPAQRSGIRAGDRIVAVDGRSTHELSTDQAANLLQGREGTTVDVTIHSPGQNDRLLRIRREQIEVPSIDGARIIDAANGVGYLKLTCFQKTTSRDLDAALWNLHRQGMRSLIIDLRGNPGGLLTTSVDVVDRFVEQGTIVSTRGRNAREDYSYSAHRPGTWRMPLVVLIDGDSASASEIFAGAIRDHRRGTIVGVQSYGKGSVQGIFPLNTGGCGVRLTTARFYSPNGLPYSDAGVVPDVVVQQTARPLDEGRLLADLPDTALEAAVSVARSEVARR